MKVPVNIRLEVRVVLVFLIDPERHEQYDQSLNEKESLCKPGNTLPTRNIVLFAARNPYIFPRSPVFPSSRSRAESVIRATCAQRKR